MKFTLLAAGAAVLASVSAQNATNATDTAAYLQTVLGALTGAGLTSLVQVASAIANTTEGAALLGSLASGNKTVYAPSNQAFNAVPQNVSSNTSLLTQILSYHILTQAYLPAGVQVSPNHTIARTALRGGIYNLPGNRTAPLVLARNSTNATSFQVLQPTSNVTAQGPVAAANLQVYVIDQVLSLPPSLGDAVTALLPALAGVVTQSGLLGPLSSASAITIFAPQDAALAAAQSTLATLNSTQIQSALGSHVINGSAVYSTMLGSGSYVSASGNPFNFTTNSTGTYVTSGPSTARIIQSDIIINNGVVHVIDGLLANTNSNPGAAQSAFESNTAAAATSMPANTMPVTATNQPSASGSGAAASSSRASRADELVARNSLLNGAIGAAVGIVGAIVGGGYLLA